MFYSTQDEIGVLLYGNICAIIKIDILHVLFMYVYRYRVAVDMINECHYNIGVDGIVFEV